MEEGDLWGSLALLYPFLYPHLLFEAPLGVDIEESEERDSVVCSGALWTCRWPEQLPSLLPLRCVHASGCSPFLVRTAFPAGLPGLHHQQAYDFWSPVACCGHSLLWGAVLVEAPSQVLSVGPTFAHRKHTFVLLSQKTWGHTASLLCAFLEVPSNMA